MTVSDAHAHAQAVPAADGGEPAGEPIVVTPGGHAPGVWGPRLARAPRWSSAALQEHLDVADGTRLLVCSAHPDDETLGAGRLVSWWRRRVGPVEAMVATAGEACLDHVGRSHERLSEIRLAEWHAALDDLGVGARTYLGLIDGLLAERQAQLSHALYRALMTEGDTAPTVVAAPWRHDPHPDHRACGSAAATAVGAARRNGAAVNPVLLEFGVWMTFWGDPSAEPADRAQLIRLATDVRADADFGRACGRFTSQLQPLAPDLTAVVPPAMLDHHRHQVIILGETGVCP